MPFLRQHAQDVRHDARYVGVLPTWHVDFACHVCYVCALCAYEEECIYTLSKRKAVACSWHIVLPFSPICVIVNSLCPTFNKYILSMLRLSIEAISGSGIRICYTPVFIDKINVKWENSCIPAGFINSCIRTFSTPNTVSLRCRCASLDGIGRSWSAWATSWPHCRHRRKSET